MIKALHSCDKCLLNVRRSVFHKQMDNPGSEDDLRGGDEQQTGKWLSVINRVGFGERQNSKEKIPEECQRSGENTGTEEGFKQRTKPSLIGQTGGDHDQKQVDGYGVQ